ncbi:sporulation inhibitor of replication protein SirA [Bacillus sp. FJAT-45350]|uniref:sporulation inhibitor of replication protein SirA n=1 Tax=Bacillus sp. FJAT-45350 TaxID=2011014 RepID=UPI000BB90934|nr:sporulation inhibitor of replication protein SirA [Bacillus sp. FJAT-45350]
MRNYTIYLIEEEVARHYFGQESKLFHLFLEQLRSSEEKGTVIQKQIEYITSPIPVLHIQQLVKQQFKGSTDYRLIKDRHYYTLRPDSHAELMIQPDKLILSADGNFEVETVFFEGIRKWSPCFFAVDLDHFRYGWLNPIKQMKLI